MGLGAGPERKIKLYSCLFGESKVQTLNEKVLCLERLEYDVQLELKYWTYARVTC